MLTSASIRSSSPDTPLRTSTGSLGLIKDFGSGLWMEGSARNHGIDQIQTSKFSIRKSWLCCAPVNGTEIRYMRFFQSFSVSRMTTVWFCLPCTAGYISFHSMRGDVLRLTRLRSCSTSETKYLVPLLCKCEREVLLSCPRLSVLQRARARATATSPIAHLVSRVS